MRVAVMVTIYSNTGKIQAGWRSSVSWIGICGETLPGPHSEGVLFGTQLEFPTAIRILDRLSGRRAW
jgi:hypothetical protein